MGIGTPPTLEELSRWALLRNEALAISALGKLPSMLFPALFEEAFSSHCTGIVKAMVVAWPFPYLRVKGMMDTFDSAIFHAVLDGLDVLLTQQVCPMRGELRVLDFRRVPCDFWIIQAGAEDGVCSVETVSVKQAGKSPSRHELSPRIKVRIDLYFRSRLEKAEMYFLQWAHQRKDSLQLCCKNVKIVLQSLDNFSGLSGLQRLYLRGFSFFSEQMKLLLRNLKTPLETFSVTHCPVLQSHLKDFALCPCLHQLKHLDLSGPLLCNVSLLPLSVLLEMGADSLETLELQGCKIKDSQFRELLPALSQCSQLTKVNFYSNDFSMNLLRDLFHHTANMSKMTMEQYPAPRECYDQNYISVHTFSQLCSQLMDTLRAIRQPKRIIFATHGCAFSPRCKGSYGTFRDVIAVLVIVAGRQEAFLAGNFISYQEEDSRKDQQEGRNEFL
ncbi:oogenesin-3-like [Chionomys nivalis]|uniref:oogenesin-3-like n=1 Tax=Chionomys nivalis TaxID=269649 RepID=UPI00259A206A|nr:oogenesin-3-like [Chionomys nivalis]